MLSSTSGTSSPRVERSDARRRRHRTPKESGIWFWFQPHCGSCGWIGEESRDVSDLEDAVLQLNEHINDVHGPVGG